jgi:hypothetical protein
MPADTPNYQVRDPVLATLGGLQSQRCDTNASVGRAVSHVRAPAQRKVGLDWLFGRMSPRPVRTVPTTRLQMLMAVPDTLSLVTSAVALWYDQHINAPTRIDTATSPILRGISLPRKWSHRPTIKDISLMAGKRNETRLDAHGPTKGRCTDITASTTSM